MVLMERECVIFAKFTKRSQNSYILEIKLEYNMKYKEEYIKKLTQIHTVLAVV